MSNILIAAYMALASILLLCLGQAIYFTPKLPNTVASHFASDGTPNGHSSKMQFVALMVGINVGTTFLTAALAALLQRMPNSMINIPNKDFWLHPDRRTATLADTQLVLLIIAATTSIFLAALFHLTCVANLGDKRLPPVAMWSVTATYLAGIGALVARTLVKYRRPVT